MLSAFQLATAQLTDPAFRRPLVRGLLGSVLIFVALWAGLWFVLTDTHLFAIGWLNQVIAALGELAAIVLAVILYPSVVAAVTSLFLDEAATAVERRYYPDLPPPRRIGLGEQVASAVRLLVISIVLNLLVLPIYLLPAINLLVFYALNGYILGREYFELVAARRFDPASMRRLWRDRRWTWLAMGSVIAFLSTLPLINLAAPLIGVAAMVHQVRRLGTPAPQRAA
jgi:CysZ protein